MPTINIRNAGDFSNLKFTAINKNCSGLMWASAKSGLRMRDAPNLNANKLKTIPYAQKVNVIQESGDILSLAKTQGKWTEVQWESNRGWVYGGFLSDLNPKLVDGDKMSELLNTLSELYSKKWDTAPFLCRVMVKGRGYHINEEGDLIPGIHMRNGELSEAFEYEFNITFHFENGIGIIKKDGWELGSEEYSFPKSLFNIKEVFSIAVKRYGDQYKEFMSVIEGALLPTSNQSFYREEVVYAPKDYKVIIKNGLFNSFRIEEVENCGDSWHFEVGEKLIVFGHFYGGY